MFFIANQGVCVPGCAVVSGWNMPVLEDYELCRWHFQELKASHRFHAISSRLINVIWALIEMDWALVDSWVVVLGSSPQ